MKQVLFFEKLHAFTAEWELNANQQPDKANEKKKSSNVATHKETIRWSNSSQKKHRKCWLKTKLDETRQRQRDKDDMKWGDSV